MEQPAAFTDAIFDRWLAGSGVGSVGNLITRHLGQIATATLQVSWSAPSPPREYATPVAADRGDPGAYAPLGLAELLSESKTVREHLVDAGAQRAHSDDLGPSPVLVIRLIPKGLRRRRLARATSGMSQPQQRAARRAAAGSWLAREGIGLVTAA